MFGAALRLMAVGEASRRVGGYVKNLITRYLVLSMAGISFAIAAAFGILAAFWAIDLQMQNPIYSALIMAGILLLIGLLIALIAYGITRGNQSARPPLAAASAGQFPDMDRIGRQIENAVRVYGPLRVAGAAMAGGIVAGLLARRFKQI
jgi:hypothetical protein